MEPFSEDINDLIHVRDKLHIKLLPGHLFSYIVIVNLDVLYAGMEDQIKGNGNCTNIIALYQWCGFDQNV